MGGSYLKIICMSNKFDLCFHKQVGFDKYWMIFIQLSTHASGRLLIYAEGSFGSKGVVRDRLLPTQSSPLARATHRQQRTIRLSIELELPSHAERHSNLGRRRVLSSDRCQRPIVSGPVESKTPRRLQTRSPLQTLSITPLKPYVCHY